MRPVKSAVHERRRILESVGFRYHPTLSVFVHPDLKQVLTLDFVEAAHRDELEHAVRAQNEGWIVHSSRPIPARSAAAILQEAARVRGREADARRR